MSTHTPDNTPPKRGLKIKSPGQKSQGLKIVAPGAEQHQLKMIKPSSQENTHQLKIKSPSSHQPENAAEQLQEIESFDPLATYVQHQETLYDMEERKRTAIIEQEEKLRKLEEMQEQRLLELEERLEQERKKLQEEKMKFEHAKREEELRHKKEEDFIKEHEREDEKRWVEFEEKIKKEEELKKKLEELENSNAPDQNEASKDEDPLTETDDDTEELDPTDDAPIKLEKKRHTDTSTCKAISPITTEASQSPQEELLKHTVDADRDELLKLDENSKKTLPSSDSPSEKEAQTPQDPQKTLVQLDPFAIDPDELDDIDTEFIEDENTHEAIPLDEQKAKTTGGFTPCFYVIDEKGIRMTPIEDDDVIFNFGRGKNNECLINDKSISETQMRAIHFKGRWTFMDTGVRDTLSFNGIKSRQLTTTSESRTAIKCGNSWIIHVGLDSSKYDETDTQLLKRSILANIPQPYVDDACVTLSYRNKARSSTMAPILAGSHASCDFRMESLKPFHFIIYWSQVGLYMEDLTKGHPGVFLGDRRISGNTGIPHTISITAGKTRFDVVVTGTQDTHRQSLADAHNNKQRLKLMPVSSQLPPIILTPGLRNLVIGRNEESDLMIKDISVSRRHAKISIRDKSVMLEDLKSINGTKVNLEKVKRSIVVPGDVVTIGNVSFLLCYEELSRAVR